MFNILLRTHIYNKTMTVEKSVSVVCSFISGIISSFVSVSPLEVYLIFILTYLPSTMVGLISILTDLTETLCKSHDATESSL